MKFIYIGLKEDGERAFKEKTGIEWMPGSEHEVTDKEVCAEMLKHPTIWTPTSEEPLTLGQAKPYPRMGSVDDAELDDEHDKAERAEKAARDAVAKAEDEAKDKAPLHTITVDEGELVLDGMEPEALHDLAKKLGVKVHHAAGAKKVIDALVASQAK